MSMTSPRTILAFTVFLAGCGGAPLIDDPLASSPPNGKVDEPACAAQWSLAFADPAPDLSSAGLMLNGENALYDSVAQRILFLGRSPIPWEVDLAKGGRPILRPLEVDGLRQDGEIWFAAVYEAANRRALLFGGQTSYGYSNRVWELDLGPGARPRWRQLAPTGAPPARRSGMSAVYDAQRRQMLVFGGNAGAEGEFNDVWSLSLTDPGAPAWERLDPVGAAPSPRSFHTAVYDATAKRMIVLGGPQLPARREVWELSLPDSGPPAWRQIEIAAGEAPSHFSGAALDRGGQRVVVFDRERDGEVWALDLAPSGPAAWTRLTEAGPTARLGFTWNTVSDPVESRILRVGGSDRLEVLALPLRDSAAIAWVSLSGPPLPVPRQYQSVVYDDAGQQAIVFGGVRARPPPDALVGPDSPQPELVLNDTLVLSGTPPRVSRLEVTGPLPPARLSHSAVYDSVNRRMIVFGGITDPQRDSASRLNDVWELRLLDNGPPVWKKLAPTGTPPTPRWGHSAVYDPSGRMIVFGGVSWVATPCPTFGVAPGTEPPTTGPASCYDRVLSAETWELTLPALGTPAWRRLDLPGPPARYGHVAVYDGARRQMVVYGGMAPDPEPRSETPTSHDNVWVLSLADPAAPVWSRLEVAGAGPGRRAFVPGVYAAEHQRVLVFVNSPATPAGVPPAPQPSVTEVWALSLSDPAAARWTLLRTAPGAPVPPVVDRHRAVYDPVSGQTWLLSAMTLNTWVLPDNGCP